MTHLCFDGKGILQTVLDVGELADPEILRTDDAHKDWTFMRAPTDLEMRLGCRPGQLLACCSLINSAIVVHDKATLLERERANTAENLQAQQMLIASEAVVLDWIAARVTPTPEQRARSKELLERLEDLNEQRASLDSVTLAPWLTALAGRSFQL